MSWVLLAGILILLVLGAGVGVGLIMGLREIDTPAPPPQLQARILDGPARIEATISAPLGRSIRIDHIWLSRSVAEALGADAPLGFVRLPLELSDQDSFEADLEELGDRGVPPSIETIENEVAVQFADATRMRKELDQGYVGFAGRLQVRPGGRVSVTIPIARIVPVEGGWSIGYSHRAGIVRMAAVVAGTVVFDPDNS